AAHPRWRIRRIRVGAIGENALVEMVKIILTLTRKGSERLLRRREEMLARGMPQAKANAATAAELVRWLWALGMMCREATE
ncbi:MAG: hypothetical protein KHZ14_09060, partial [Collinsella sp.]|nr:hypothetical protein [Collinsella sp.]